MSTYYLPNNCMPTEYLAVNTYRKAWFGRKQKYQVVTKFRLVGYRTSKCDQIPNIKLWPDAEYQIVTRCRISGCDIYVSNVTQFSQNFANSNPYYKQFFNLNTNSNIKTKDLLKTKKSLIKSRYLPALSTRRRRVAWPIILNDSTPVDNSSARFMP